MAQVKVPRGRRVVGYLPAPDVVAVHNDGRRVPIVAWLTVEDENGNQEMHGLVLYRGCLMSVEDAWSGVLGLTNKFLGYEVDGAPLTEA